MSIRPGPEHQEVIPLGTYFNASAAVPLIIVSGWGVAPVPHSSPDFVDRVFLGVPMLGSASVRGPA